QWWMVAIVSGLLFIVLAFVIIRQVQWPLSGAAPAEDSIALLGQNLMSTYALPFEAASVLLLVALVGAIIIARERE
ncbi:MAG TPA: NADH-quinone oxidoreductase subunit J, partial [Anaerolineae bacterium]|nr:NADH-quinone oxidoreductase subunit J [Anaerolineae bacterium]